MSVNVKVIGVENFITQQKQFITILANAEVEKLAEETAVVMKQKISDGLTRPGSTGTLANAINAEKINNLSWGVGNISFLNQNVKYWRHINFGSLAIGANWQHRVPKGGFVPGNPSPDGNSFGEGRWSPFSNNFSFIPNKPIPAKNYIDKTISEIPGIIARVLGK